MKMKILRRVFDGLLFTIYYVSVAVVPMPRFGHDPNTGDTVQHCDGVETVEEAHNEATVLSLHSVLVSANLCSLMVNFDLLMTSD